MALLTCKGCGVIKEEEKFQPVAPGSNYRRRECYSCLSKKRWAKEKVSRAGRGNWLMFGCVHIPFEHPDCFRFLEALQVRYEFKRVFMMGDLYDWTGLNRFSKNPNLPSPVDEYKATIGRRDELYKLFPNVEMLYGNHDLRPLSRAAEHYIPELLIKSLREVMGLPDGWVSCGMQLVAEHASLGDVVLIHGDKVNRDALVNARQIGKHLVMADRHTMCKVAWSQDFMGRKVFGMNVGALVDAEREAFAYSKGRVMRPMISVGAIIDNNPVNLVMNLDGEGRWTGDL